MRAAACATQIVRLALNLSAEPVMKRPLDCGALDVAGRAEGAAGHVRSADPGRGVIGRQARGGADGQGAVAVAVEDNPASEDQSQTINQCKNTQL